MAKFRITEIRREIWEHYFEIEAASQEAALTRWREGYADYIADPEYIDSVHSDHSIEEIADDK